MGARRRRPCSTGFEVIPRRRLEYKGQWLEEMDLDAIIARHPQIALVDELAHTNAPGSRHPKRYLDIEELLNRGIDVYTTVNIQHIESLNDVVAQITHVRVRETVPDSVFDRADAIELVDLTPDDLIERLKEGKVYVPKQAERALEHYFSPGNLTALRELALRRTAERVDEQLLTHMQAHAIPGPWAAGERILVCVSEDPRAAGLVRYAKRLADRLHAPFTALCVETRRSLQWSEEERDRVADTLRLAEALGGEAITIPGGGRSIADDVISFAQANNVTQIIIGKSTRSRWFEILHGSVVHDLVRRSGNISVHVIAGDELARDPIPKKTLRAAEGAAPFDPWPYLVALAAVAAALGVGELIQPVLGIENVDLVFLTAVVAVAVRYGLWPSLLATVASSLCYNFFFLPPTYTFTIADPTNLAALVFFTVVAVVVSHFAARGRTQTVAAHERVRAVELLYAFSRKLAGVGTLDDVLWATAYQAALMLKVRVVLLLPEDGSIVVKAGYPPEDRLDEADVAAAKWAWQNNRVAGRGSDTLPGAKRLFLPMRTGRGAIGVMGIDSDKTGPLAHSRSAPSARRLDRSGRARHRACISGRGCGPGETHDRDGSAAFRPADLDLTRSQDAARRGAGSGQYAARVLERADRYGKSRPAGDRHRRIRAAQSLHRQSARHDQARIRRHRAEHGAARSRRDRRQRVAPREQDPGAASDRIGARRRPADAGAGRSPVRAGPVQPAGQCRQVFSRRHHHPDPELARSGCGLSGGSGRRRWHTARGPGAHLRQVLSGGKGRSGAGRHGTRSRDLAGLRGSAARADHGGKPYRPGRRGIRDQAAGTAGDQATGHRGMSAAPLKVLVVDDEPPIRKLLRMGLSTQGYEILEASNGKASLDLLSQNPDLVILDLGLPDMQGLELLRMIRARNEAVPIVVLSSRGDEVGKVQALDLGADDYITKPFGMDELLARMRAALRHQLQVHGERPIFRTGDLSVDLVRRIVKVADREVKLSPKEYDLLRVLVQHAGKVLTHKFLLGELWDTLTDAQYLRVYVRQLRQKIEADPERPHFVLTETGIGYRLRGPD